MKRNHTSSKHSTIHQKQEHVPDFLKSIMETKVWPTLWNQVFIRPFHLPNLQKHYLPYTSYLPKYSLDCPQTNQEYTLYRLRTVISTCKVSCEMRMQTLPLRFGDYIHNAEKHNNRKWYKTQNKTNKKKKKKKKETLFSSQHTSQYEMEQLVSQLVLKPNQLQRITSGLRETFIKKYILERTRKVDITPEKQSEKAGSCRENLWHEIQLKGL